jgi:hypothetical protein
MKESLIKLCFQKIKDPRKALSSLSRSVLCSLTYTKEQGHTCEFQMHSCSEKGPEIFLELILVEETVPILT